MQKIRTSFFRFAVGCICHICQHDNTADEERFELSTWCLTNTCSAIELFIHCWPGAIRTHNLPVKSRKLSPIELRTNIVATFGVEPKSSALWEQRVSIYTKSQFVVGLERLELSSLRSKHSILPLNYKPNVHTLLVDSGARTLFFRCTDGCFTK